jgi:predicted 3-demethylubiquinone-9 3-methyltransferase (glyoxalase superfamily)
MPARALTRIVPHFWYIREAEEAARLYCRIFPRSRIDRLWSVAHASCVEFRLFGQPFFAMSAGEHHPFNDAISFRVNCKTQKEVDSYWSALLKDGGKEFACGWLADKYGVRWQITPIALMEMMVDRNKEKAALVEAEMQRQIKFDIAKLKAAFKG